MNVNIKDEVLLLVQIAITEHPEWLADMVLTMQRGITIAIRREEQRSADLAYGFVTLALAAPKKTERNKDDIQPGLRALVEFFEGSMASETVKQWINEE